MNPIYILNVNGISPQDLNSADVQQPHNGYFNFITPDYSEYIPPMQSRRMPKTLKMGIYTAMQCMKWANIERPDGVITATSKGSLSDTEKFVNGMIEYGEEALNPTPFIMSTYNTINGAIALQTQATGYNQTFVHAGSALESAFFDAQLKLNEPTAATLYYLVGCFDEMPEQHLDFIRKIGGIKQNYDTKVSLLHQADTPGSIIGNGVHFFLASNKKDNAVFSIKDIKTWSHDEVSTKLEKFLSKNGLGSENIDLLLLGMNGDSRSEKAYQDCMQYFAKDMPVLCFKNICGEYQTAMGFGLEVLYRYLDNKKIPDELWYKKTNSHKKPLNILCYNHFDNIDHNLMLIENCVV